jgi:hypothetical protein
MRPLIQYPILADLLKPFHWRQQETIACVLAALLQSGTARSSAIASLLAQWSPIRLDSALNRFYRLLRNPRVSTLLLTKQLLRLLAQKLGV